MKNLLYNISIALTAISLAACGDNKPDTPEPVDPTPSTDKVEVTISTTAIETKAAITEFKSTDKMNIYAKTYGRIDAPNIIDDVVATLEGSTWKMSPAVYIDESQKNAFVYAVAPYDASYVDPQKIPVDLAKQVDLMYSGSYVPASLTSPAIKLNMKHALSLLTFNIVPVNYSGNGTLTSLEINGDILYSKGTMDASTGKITTSDKGKVEAKVNKTVQQGGWKSDIPGIWVLPFNTKTGTVTLTATIDGKTYQAELPEVEVKTGWQYIFRLALTNNGLEFDPAKTETISLNVNTDESQDFVGYGQIVLISNGSWINSPTISGDAVFGTLITPTGNSAYNGSQRVENLKAGDKVTVETWNSNGFVLESLDGVSTIDISQFE